MARYDQQEQPAAPPLYLGFHSLFPTPAQFDVQSTLLSRDLQDLRLDEGERGEGGEERGSEASEEKGEGNGEDEGGENKGENGKATGTKQFYPQRSGEPNCTFYMKRGKCSFGRTCKFNHPWLGKKGDQQVQSEDSSELAQAVEDDDVKEAGEEKYSGKVGKIRCKYFDTPGGCEYGSACRYNHSEEKKEAGQVELNFLGLPVRPGEKECHFYMRNGSCKFSSNCRYHHPDPSASGGRDTKAAYFGSSSSHLHVSSAPQISAPLHTPQRPPTNSFPFIHGPPYVPPMPVVHHPPLHFNSGWNGYQPPMEPSFAPEASGRYMPVPPAQSPPKTSNDNKYQQKNQTTEFPRRPGQPDCPYYMKSGDCKFKSACKFNHPKDQLSSACLLSPKGLPLRPGQSVCTHYSRYGICKFGPTCMYDHPMDHIPSQTMAQ